MPSKKGRRPKVERRSSTRADASLSMRVEGRPEGGELTKIVTESENISANGVYCSSPHYLAPLSKIALTIVLPSQGGTGTAPRLLKCEGVVVRCRPREDGPRRGFELACSFIGLDPRQRGLLDDFVTRRNLQVIRTSADSTPRASRSTARPRGSTTLRRGTVARRTTATRARRTARTRRSAGR
jgi:c-di-GMP-binding flagellar brake protein YcgR